MAILRFRTQSALKKMVPDLTNTETVYKRSIRTISLKVKRPDKSTHKTLQKITSPDDVFEILRAIFNRLDDDQEHFILLALNAANKVIGFKHISSGGQDEAIVDPKAVFRCALLLGARSIIVAHNHPSGNPQISWQDEKLTRQLVSVGELLNLPCYDHIIYTHYSFTSFRAECQYIFRFANGDV